MTTRKPGDPYTAAERKAALAMCAGSGLAATHRATGIPKGTLSGWARAAGIDVLNAARTARASEASVAARLPAVLRLNHLIPCPACKTDQPLADYGTRRDGTTHTRCRSCRRQRPLGDPAHRERHYRKRFGITLAEFDAMVTAQDGRCAICNSQPDVLSLDHDHNTGAIRSPLCRSCNTGLGHMKDDPALLRAAANYLDAHRTKATE